MLKEKLYFQWFANRKKTFFLSQNVALFPGLMLLWNLAQNHILVLTHILQLCSNVKLKTSANRDWCRHNMVLTITYTNTDFGA